MSRGVFVICTMLLVRVGAKHFHPRSPATHPPLQSAPAVLQQTFEARGQQPLTCFLPRYGSGSSSEASLPSLLSPGQPAISSLLEETIKFPPFGEKQISTLWSCVIKMRASRWLQILIMSVAVVGSIAKRESQKVRTRSSSPCAFQKEFRKMDRVCSLPGLTSHPCFAQSQAARLRKEAMGLAQGDNCEEAVDIFKQIIMLEKGRTVRSESACPPTHPPTIPAHDSARGKNGLSRIPSAMQSLSKTTTTTWACATRCSRM